MQRHKGRQFMASAEEGDIYGDECYSLDKTPRANSEARLNKQVNFIFILKQKHCSVNSSSFSSFFVSSHLPGGYLRITHGSFWAHFRHQSCAQRLVSA